MENYFYNVMEEGGKDLYQIANLIALKSHFALMIMSQLSSFLCLLIQKFDENNTFITQSRNNFEH